MNSAYIYIYIYIYVFAYIGTSGGGYGATPGWGYFFPFLINIVKRWK